MGHFNFFVDTKKTFLFQLNCLFLGNWQKLVTCGEKKLDVRVLGGNVLHVGFGDFKPCFFVGFHMLFIVAEKLELLFNYLFAVQTSEIFVWRNWEVSKQNKT